MQSSVATSEAQDAETAGPPKTSWVSLIALALAQFVMVLDQSAMNVSISPVDDFDTTVATIQAVITLYCLVMAIFMLTGGKMAFTGDLPRQISTPGKDPDDAKADRLA